MDKRKNLTLLNLIGWINADILNNLQFFKIVICLFFDVQFQTVSCEKSKPTQPWDLIILKQKYDINLQHE